MPLVFIILAGYLLGSVPTGLVVGKFYKGIDIRQYGSGNIGATNVLRTIGFGASVVVLAADLGKGILPVLAARVMLDSPVAEAATAFAALVGHNWSLYLRFRGGRGVATALGSFLVMSPGLTLVALGTGVVVVVISRYVSLGSLVGAVTVLGILAVSVILGREPSEYLIYCVPGVILLFIQHRDNIARLVSGRELKLGERGELKNKG